MPTHIGSETIKFLRGLAKHNDREWFEARRAVYEESVRAPMLALVEAINAEMPAFAPEHVRPAHKTVMRIYRDIRFSKNKLPYKTHLAAWWARRGMEKTSGGGFYLQIGPKGVMLAAAVYMPQREQLLKLREWMSANHLAYRKLLKSVVGKKLGLEPIDGEPLTRMPKGFAPDDPAGELLRAKHWGVRVDLPAESALEAGFVKEVVKRFKAAAPLVDMLNGAILGDVGDATDNVRAPRRPLF
jgi:uncharacterized protein (TIGR02453 family)